MKVVMGANKKDNTPRVFAAWSGGKDGCLAVYRALNSGMDLRYLANMVSEDGRRSWSHGIRAEVIKAQADALGIPIVQKRAAGDTYEVAFVEMLKEFKREGIEGGVFGDIDFPPHREWNEKVCKEADITPHLPLWGEDQKKLLEEFIDAGFKAVVVTVKADLLGREIPGRRVDRKFLAYVTGLNKDITPCGEAGEYHTLVVDGPIFIKRLIIVKSEKITRGDYHFLEILATELKAKKPAGR
jgi:diphthine-ammonia ligase